MENLERPNLQKLFLTKHISPEKDGRQYTLSMSPHRKLDQNTLKSIQFLSNPENAITTTKKDDSLFKKERIAEMLVPKQMIGDYDLSNETPQV
jgi:hypothetical protein